MRRLQLLIPVLLLAAPACSQSSAPPSFADTRGAPTLDIPQVCFAQNPWCLVEDLPRRSAEKLKASLQRRAYRQAMRTARLMVFNSEYMRRAYRENAGFEERSSLVVYPAVSEETHAAARAARCRVSRNPMKIVSVSAMAPHKGADTLVRAVAEVRTKYAVPAELSLVGSWPDREYEAKVRALAAELSVEDTVTFHGYTPQDELHRHYAEARAFCLMSRCESFGIPAVEAQSFGTPVVSSNCCAIPEVCGRGGLYPEPGDVRGTAKALARLLGDGTTWEELSRSAVENAAKYKYDLTSRPLMRMFEIAEDQSRDP